MNNPIIYMYVFFPNLLNLTYKIVIFKNVYALAHLRTCTHTQYRPSIINIKYMCVNQIKKSKFI